MQIYLSVDSIYFELLQSTLVSNDNDLMTITAYEIQINIIVFRYKILLTRILMYRTPTVVYSYGRSK